MDIHLFATAVLQSIGVRADVQVSDVAGKEFSIESALDKMALEWEGANLQLLEYRATGTYVIKLEDTLLQQLDDHIGEPLVATGAPLQPLSC